MPVEIKDIKQKSISGSSNPIEEYFNDKQKALKKEPSTAITKSNPIDDYFKKKSGTEDGGAPSPTPSPTPSPSPEKENDGYLDVLKKWHKKGQEALAAKKSEPVEETEFDSGARATTLEQARKQGGLAVFKKAKKLKVEAGNGVILDLDPSIASNISEPNYNADIESIQKRIKEGKVLPEDINIISALAKKTPEATAAYLTGDTQKGLAIDNTENQKTLRSDMIRSITHYNEETGEENDPEAILGSAQKTVEFIQKLKQQKAAKIQQGFDLEKQALEGQQGAQTTFVDGKFVPTPVQQNVATDGLDAESFINKANEYQELLKSHVITQTIQEDEKSGVPKEQTLKNIARRTNPRLYYQSINAQIPSAPNLLNPIEGVGKMYDDLFGTDGQDELLNTQYGAASLKYNEAQQQLANNEISQGILTGDQELLTKGKGRLANVQNQNEILLQYPSLMKQKIAQDVSKELAFKAGQLEGSETEDYKTKFLGVGIGNIYGSEAMQKYLADPNTRDLAASMLLKPELFADASYLGGVGDAFMQPLKDLGLSLMDMTKFRTNKDVLSDKIKDELFPKEMEGTKADFTVPILGDIRVRHIANTTANLTGMAVVAAGTSGIATPLGASANVAKSLSAYTSFGLPTYDGALKDSYNFLDNDNARVLYAGIASIANAEGGRFLDIGKVIKIPGVSENFAKIADGITKNNITQKGVQQLLKKGENAYVDFAVKYGKNVTKGAATMAYFNITNNIERLAFGDDRIKEAEVLPQAAHAFVDGVLGMTIMGAFGARADMKSEKNTTFKANIYNMALNHDAAKDALKISLDKGFYTPEQYNEKLQILNTAIAAKNSLDLSEQQLNRSLTQDQKSVYVANRTAESVLREKSSDKNISEADKIKYTEQADRLRQQSKDVMDGLRFSPTLEPLYDLFNAEKEYDRALSEFDNTPKSQRRVEVAKENYDGLVNKYLVEKTKPVESKEDSDATQLRNVESTTKALEDISKNKPTIWQSVKDAFNKGVNKVFGGSLKMKDSEKLSPDKIKARVELIAQKLGATIEYKPHPLGAAFNIANDGKFYITIDPKLFDKGLGNQEAFNTINVIAHELGHAIDAKEVLKNNLSDTEISELAKLHRAFINTFNFDVGEDISGLETAIKNNNKNITGDEKATKISDLRNPETNAHRHEQEELFADALRMMVISPELAKRLAPNLFERLSKHGLGDNEHQSIAEAYHDAKSKGIENDFTKAVEQSTYESKASESTLSKGQTKQVELSDEAHRAIEEGIKSGAINDIEASMLNTTENKIQFLKQVAEQAKGEFTGGEKVGEGGEQSRAARKKYGEEIVDEALKMFPQKEKVEATELKKENDVANEEYPADISIGEMIDKTGTYKGERGSFYQDGQTIVFKVENKNKEYELGNIEEIKNTPISDFGISHEESVVEISENGNIKVRDEEYSNNYSNPLSAINKDKDGNVVSVNLETLDGKKRTFRGNVAEDIAYQINLKEINKNNETRAEFEQHLNEDEVASKEMDNGEVLEAAKTKPVENNEPVSREEIKPTAKVIQLPKREEVKSDKVEKDAEAEAKRIIEDMDSAAQSKKSVREKEKEMEKVAEKNGELGKKALELNRNFDSIVKFLKDNNKIEVKCP